ncbi:otogelin [Esox lucius]|uniref:otogelin n=1 Tax=Esox lucius TaxID=8010 RepID=UPI001476A2C4|nr:otogelin [Esox lucius]
MLAKWDTASQRGQEFHRMTDALATNELSASESTSIASVRSTSSNSSSVNLTSVNSSSVVELHYFNTTLVVSSSGSKAALRSTIDNLKATGPCVSPCLNGGHCVHTQSCDCSLYQATGTHCQTVPNLGLEREMTCRSWGQYNYETFDGLYYHFPGKCTYTLLRDCEDNAQGSVIVQVHNDPECRSSPYSCTRSVSLFLPWEGEIRLHRSKVTFKGQSVQLPHHIHDVELERISGYVLVTQQHGFTLAWDGHSGSVYVKLSPEWVGRACGLCGNFNADLQDDLKTSYGVVTEDLAVFGNSWVEEEPHHSRCPMVLSMYPSPCSSRDPHILLKVKEVCAMLLEQPFTACHEFVSPLSYMASCSNDLCLSGPSSDEVCQVLTEYARACAHADHPLLDWRTHIPQCALVCPAELQYKECITCCPATCNMDRMCIDSKLQCLDGCYCPDELIYEEGKCVKASECPCEYHGMIYPSGQSVQEECNNCTCKGGVWNCTEYSCPGECSVTGDMYFHSFDGRMFTFPASCQYVLAKSHNSGKFTVTIQNAPCGPNLDGACIQSVSLVIDEDPRTEITMSHLGEVFMAGQYRISLPYSDEVFHIQELSSMFLQVRTAPGLHLQYSWREFRLYLQVDELWKGNTVGLCGTFNGNIQDDFLLFDFLSPSGMIESTPHLFGNAWKVSSACVPSHSVPQMDPCDTHQQAASYASEMCDILNQELFSSCHGYLSPVPFHQQCLSDTCKCGQPCLCSSLAHYARHCRRYSVIIQFRASVPDCAVTCPETMEYGTCVSSCQRRCSALSTQQHCGEECEEGCVCPPGTFYSTRTHTCVSRHSCPCSFLGADYAPGDVIMTSSGVQLCQDGKLVSLSSAVDKQCPLGQTYVDCVEGLSPGGGLGCEHTCESHLLNLTCSAHEPCVPGCVCPHGLLKHGDECFEPDACPCLWKGKEYYPGDKVTSPCHHCVCQHGTFQCVFRPCPSMCTTYGDRHYRTFDGLLFDYVGACKVYLVKSSGDLMMSVMAENVDCYDSGVICRKSLLINIGRSFIAFDDDSGKPNPSSVMDRKQEVFIWSAGYFTVVHVPEEDLTVLWDHKTTVHIQAGARWQGKLSGLCGNFDQRTVNEMRTPENIDSATPQEFGNSWTAAECVNSPDTRHPCTLNPLREPFAKRQCGVLLSEVFQVCHPVVDVTWFYTNCLADTCGCSRGGDCECFCTSVAAYAHRCCHQGVAVDWRSPSTCPYDCEYYNKVLGKGPYRLVTYREKSAVLAANRSSGTVFANKGEPTKAGIMSLFMMTPGLSRARPHDTSLVSFEASKRPNYFLVANRSGHVRLSKWDESEAFWDAATFVLHRDTWIQGYVSLEAFTRPRFFLHFTSSWIHLMKYKHTDGFRKATLFKLTGSVSDSPTGPRCQWRYESCVSPCFRTCSDPSRTACVTIPKVEGCQPLCPDHMVLDEVTQRCVHTEDCIKPPVAGRPITTVSSTESTAAAVATTASSRPASPGLVTARSTASPGPPGVLVTTTPTDAGRPTSATATPLLTTSTSPSELDARTTMTEAAPPVTSPAVPTPETPSHVPAVGPDVEVVEAVSAVETSSVFPSTTVGRVERTTAVPSPVGRSTEKTSQVPFPVTTSNTTWPPSSTTVGPWVSSTVGPTQTSTLPTLSVFPTKTTIRVTTLPTDTVSPLFSISSPQPTAVTETSRGTAKTTDRITTPLTTLSLHTESRTKPVIIETTQRTTTVPLPLGVTTTVATTVSSLPPTTPFHTSTVTKPPEPTSKHITESTSPVIPFTTIKTTASLRTETTHPLISMVSTEKMVHTSTEVRTSVTHVPEPPTTPVVDKLPTSTTTSTTPRQLTSQWTGRPKKTTISVTMATSAPSATASTSETTTVAPPVKLTDTVTTTPRPPATSLASTEKTSRPTSVATTERTRTEGVDWRLTATTTAGPSATQPIPPEPSITTTKPPEVPVTTSQTTFPTSTSVSTTTRVMVPTIWPVSPVSLTGTATVPRPATSQAPTQLKTTELWGPPHRESPSTSSVFTSSTERVTTPEISVKPDVSTKLEVSPHQVISATPVTGLLQPVPTSTQPVITMGTSDTMMTTAKTSTMADTSAVVISTSRSERPERPVTPEPLTTMVSTTTVPPLPGVDTTTIRPVTIRPLTETTRTPPDTGRVEVSTATTQQPTSSWSGPITTTPFTSTTTRPERVTTRVVSSTTAPATTRTTRPERVTTRVISSTTAPATTRTTRPKTTTHRTTTGRVPTTTSRATATVRSTGIPPSTDRVTIAMRPTVVPTTSVRATMKPVTTARTTEYPADVSSTVSTSETTTTAASSVPIPSLTVVTLSTAVPAGKTTVAEPAKSTTPVERIETSSTRVTPTAKEPTTTRTPVPGLVTSTEVGATPGVKPKVTTEFTPAVPATASVPALPTTATPASTAVTDGVDRVSPYTTPERTPSPSPVSPYTTPEKTPSLSPVSPYTTPEKTPSLSPVSPYTTPEKTPSLSPVSPYTTPEKTPSLSPVSPYTTPEKTPSLSPVSPYTKPEKTPSLSPVSPYTTPEKTPSLSPVSPYTTPEKTPSLSPVSPYTTPEKTPSLSPVSPYTTPEKTPSLSPVSPYTTPEKTLSPSSVSPHTTPEKTPSPSSVSPHTTPEKTPSPSSVSPHTTPESIEPPAKATTTMAVSSTRMCTPPYSEMVDECTKNICVSGQLVMFNKSQNCPYDATPPNCGLLGFAILVNGDKCCPQWDCPCRCSVFPDLNVITFDGNSVAVYKAASYIVSQLPNETISVVVQECPAASDSLLWNFTNLCLVALNITHKTNHVIINRLQRRLYVNSRYAKPRFKKFGFEVLDTGNMYLIRTPAGLSLQWFHSTGMMVIETESYDNKLPTMGLCGHCDGNPANDLMLSNGTTIGEGEDPALFIDSWQVPNTTSYVSQSRRREVNCTTSDCSRCLDMLQNTSFSPCHAFVPVSTFCEVWVRDAEYVNNPCVALAAYVASCHKFNVCIEWRSPDYCPFICPEELRYQACLPGCTAQSCSNHDFDYNHVQCSGLTEGCVCPEGTLLHRPYSALCVPQEKCACTDSSGVPHAHGEVWKASKDGCCMYRCDNDSVVPVEYNCSAVPQPLCRRAGEVIVGLADDASCCPRRVCVCNQTLCDVFPPECQYGEKLVSYFREDSCCPDYACECDPERCELDIPACRDDQTLIATRADGSCCLAHICMCAACSDVVPECQNGEVLTVDFNSTDRCCPIYHCVCEPYRCAEITCPLGMSAVSMSTPERCCPQYTCECACDKMSSPKCSLGETLQEDRASLADPVNQCGCKRFSCVREAVCVYGERGVMHPGQTLVEHGEDGVCLTTQCTRSLDQTTGFHRLRTTTSNCSAHCQPNQIYIPPKDQTSCCGVCKNISCLYQNKNGTAILYKPGKSWVSNCTKYECTDTLSGPTLVSYSFSCPPFNETDCMKIGGTVVSYMDGCCKTCKEDGKACQKVTVRMTIRKNDCRSNRPVNIVSCDGKCPSASIYNYNINTYARFCKCCREMGLQRRSVPLYCNGNSTWVSYSVQEPTDCSCQWS